MKPLAKEFTTYWLVLTVWKSILSKSQKLVKIEIEMLKYNVNPIK